MRILEVFTVLERGIAQIFYVNYNTPMLLAAFGHIDKKPATAHGSRLTAHGSRLTAHGSRLTAHGSRLTAHGS
ncbi:MAG: hypothetical protein LBE02_06860, partial [Spirochaetaceae bacterium]|nr:hypothetical protein [Spirochaetaceae bacterium]